MNFTSLLLDTLFVPVYLLVFLLVGRFFYGNLTSRFTIDFQKNFIELFFGFIFCIILYALIKSNGKTVLLLLLLMLCWQYFAMKIKPDISFLKKIRQSDFMAIGILYLFFILFFGVQLFRHEYFNPDFVRIGWGDYGFYSDLGESFNIYGIERIANWYNYFNNSFVSYSDNPSPYHYFEIWTNAFLLKFAANKGVFVFIYIFTPFISMLVSGAFLSLAYSYIKKGSNYQFVLLLFSAFIFTFFIGVLPFKAGGQEGNVICYPRVFLFYILFINFIIFLKIGLKKEAIFFLAFIGFTNILYLPTVTVTLILLALYQYFIIDDKSTARVSLSTAIFLLLSSYLFYYIIFKSDGSLSISSKRFFPLKAYIYEGLINYFRLNLMRMWFFYLPLSVFALYFLFRSIKLKKFNMLKGELVFIAVALELVSLFFASFVPHLEQGSFNSTVVNPLFAMISFLAILYLINNASVTGKLILVLLYGQAIYSVIFVTFNLSTTPFTGNKISKSFLREVAKNDISNKMGAFVLNKNNFNKSVFENTNTSWFSAIFDIKDNGYTQVSLSTQISEDSIPFDDIKHYVQYSPMYKYGNNKINGLSRYDRDSIDLAFIREYRLGYVVILPDASIPVFLEPFIKNIIQDPISKIRILYLHNLVQSNNQNTKQNRGSL